MKYTTILLFLACLCFLFSVTFAQDMRTKIFAGKGNPQSTTMSFFILVETNHPLTSRDTITFLGALTSEVGELYDIESLSIRGRQHLPNHKVGDIVTKAMVIPVENNHATFPLELADGVDEIVGDIQFVGEITFRKPPTIGMDNARIVITPNDTDLPPKIYDFDAHIVNPVTGKGEKAITAVGVHRPNDYDASFLYLTIDEIATDARGIMFSLIGHHNVNWQADRKYPEQCYLNSYPTEVLFGEFTSVYIVPRKDNDDSAITFPKGSRITLHCPDVHLVSPFTAAAGGKDRQFDDDKLQITLLPIVDDDKVAYAHTIPFNYVSDEMVINLEGDTEIEPHLLSTEFVFNNRQIKNIHDGYKRKLYIKVSGVTVTGKILMHVLIFNKDSSTVEVVDSKQIKASLVDGIYISEEVDFVYNDDLDTLSHQIDLQVHFYVPIQENKAELLAEITNLEMVFSQPSAEKHDMAYSFISRIAPIEKTITLNVNMDLHDTGKKDTKIPIDLKYTSPGAIQTYVSNLSYELAIDGDLESCTVNGKKVTLLRHFPSIVSYNSENEFGNEIHFTCKKLFWASPKPLAELPDTVPIEVAGYGLNGRIGRINLITLSGDDAKSKSKTGIVIAICLFCALGIALAIILVVKCRKKCSKKNDDATHQSLLDGTDEYVN